MPLGAVVVLLAHVSTGIINTWGFAYVGGIVGLFSVSLLYVKGKVTDRSSGVGQPSKRSGLAALGPGVIVAGGVCGVSFGLGGASLVERLFFDDVDVVAVVSQLCDPAYDPSAADPTLHDDIEHLADDLDATTARGVHRELHDDALDPAARELLVDRLVAELTAAEGSRIASCEAFDVGESVANS